MSEKQQEEKTQTGKLCLIISLIALVLSVVSLLNIAVVMKRLEKEEPISIEWHDRKICTTKAIEGVKGWQAIVTTH